MFCMYLYDFLCRLKEGMYDGRKEGGKECMNARQGGTTSTLDIL